MSRKIKMKVGKKYAVHLPKAIVEELGLREGDRLLARVENGKIILEPIRDPLWLAIKGEKITSIDPEEVERISLEEQSKYLKNPS